MISILTPTRGRPHLLERFLLSLISNEEPGIPWEVIALIDEDDPSLADYRLVFERNSFRVRGYLCGSHPTISEKFNLIAPRIASNIWGVADDDLVCESAGWNRMVKAIASPDGLWYASVSGCGEAFFFGVGIYKFLGYITPPHIGHYWAVTWTKEILNSVSAGEIQAQFVEHPQEDDETHQWLFREHHKFIGLDCEAYNRGTETIKYQAGKLRDKKQQITA